MPRRRTGLVDWSAAARRTRELLDFVGLEDVDPRQPVRRLAVAQLQLLEMARALSARARVLTADEPTSTWSRYEIERLFGIVRRLRQEGVAVVYISHHLDEIFQLTDELTVLRDGRVITTCETAAVDLDGLVRLMVGREVEGVAAQLGSGAAL